MNEFFISVSQTAEDGGLIACFIGVLSLLISFLSLRIYFRLKKYVDIPEWLEDKVLAMMEDGKTEDEIIDITSLYSEFFANILGYIFKAEKEERERLWTEIYFAEFLYFRNNINFLKSIISSAPLAGLLGTVWGMINTFSAISTGYSTAMVSEGISQALVTTQFGLIAALPGLFAVSILSGKVSQLEIRFRNLEINLRSGEKYEKIQ